MRLNSPPYEVTVDEENQVVGGTANEESNSDADSDSDGGSSGSEESEGEEPVLYDDRCKL